MTVAVLRQALIWKFHTHLINTGLQARWSRAIRGQSRFNGFYEVREAVETAFAIPDALTPGWKPGVNERPFG
jgi:hypothetical protein